MRNLSGNGGCGGMVSVLILFVGLFWLLFDWVAHAHDYGQWENTDPEIKAWFQWLKQPDNPTKSCCGKADGYWCDTITVEGSKVFCAITDTRDDAPLGRPHVEIGTKIEIPPEKMKFGKTDPQHPPSNPTGHSIVFIWTTRDLNNRAQHGVYCFVPDVGT